MNRTSGNYERTLRWKQAIHASGYIKLFQDNHLARCPKDEITPHSPIDKNSE